MGRICSGVARGRRAYRQPMQGEEPVHVVYGEVGRQGKESIAYLHLKNKTVTDDKTGSDEIDIDHANTHLPR